MTTTNFCRTAPAALLVLLTAACGTGMPTAPGRSDLSAEIVRLNRPGPPDSPPGTCWDSDTTPAIIETVTTQVALPATDGAPAAFRTETRQRMVQDREQVWFRAPCPADMTVQLIATLQRALKARGYYPHPVTGQIDAPTRAALRKFQAERGLDSARLSLAAARELGLTTTDLDQL
ncbi:MAG: peptidoglycan-binding domain-containing protein [Pseudomonadota bacterium]|jgi:Putative peptidoglycan binding domain